jgi:hypothetical protein
MTSHATGLLLLAALALADSTQRTPSPPTEPALAARIDQLVEKVLASEDDSKETETLAEARAIVERHGVPTTSQVGDAAAYGFVMLNMHAQPQDFRVQFLAKVREAAARHELPADAVTFAEARFRQAESEERYKARTPALPALRDEILRLYEADQAVRAREGFDLQKMVEADRKTAGPLNAIFNRHGVPTYDMVGVDAAQGFVVMVQHQSPEFRAAVLPKLKANVDAGQADPGTYASVYDRTQRDQSRNQLYGEQLECAAGEALHEAPMDDAQNVNARRAGLGLIRLDLYERLVRIHSPDRCK